MGEPLKDKEVRIDVQPKVLFPIVGYKKEDIKSVVEWFKAKIFFIDKKEDILKVLDEAFPDLQLPHKGGRK